MADSSTPPSADRRPAGAGDPAWADVADVAGSRRRLAELEDVLARELEAPGPPSRAVALAAEHELQGWAATPPVALSWWRLGLVWKTLDREPQAATAFLRAAAALAEGGDEAGAADAYQAAARTLVAQQRHREASDAFRRAVYHYEAAGGSAGAATARSGLAGQLAAMGYHRAAVRVYSAAEHTFSSAGRPVEAAVCAAGVARCLTELGRLRDAVEKYDAAARALAECGQWARVARCRMDQAEILALSGQAGDASRRLGEAEIILSRLSDETHLAECHVIRADAARVAGDPGEALRELQVARSAFSGGGACGRLAAVDLRRAIAFRDVGDLEEAAAALEAAWEWFGQAGDDLAEAYCHLTRGSILLGSGDLEEASRAFERADGVFAPMEKHGARVHSLGGLARARERAGDDQRALDAYLAGTDVLEAVMETVGRDDAYAAGLRAASPDCFSGAIRLMLGDAPPPDRVSGVGQPEICDRRPADRWEQALWLSERARSVVFRKELAYSVAAGQTPLDGVGEAAWSRWRSLHARLAALAGLSRGTADGRHAGLEPASQVDAGSRDRWAVRQRLLTQLDEAEARLFAAVPAAGELVSHRLPDPREVLSRIAADEGMVVLHRADHDLVCFLVRDTGVAAIAVLPQGWARARTELDALSARVADCEREAGPGPRSAGWGAPLGRLGELLLGPAADCGWLGGARGVRRLTFVPSGDLHGLPFGALTVPGSERAEPLVSRCEVGLLPQLTARYYLDLRVVSGEGSLGIVDPDGTLSLGDPEAVVLRAAVPEMDLSVGGMPFKVSAGSFPKVVRGYRRLHLSCHGVFEPRAPLESALLLAPDLDGGAPSRLTVRQLYAVPGRFELIVAAACESGESLVLAGDAMFGLSRALLYLSRWVVSALWQVNEQSTLILTDLFYRSLGDGVDPVAALSRAQRVLLDPSDPRYPPSAGLDLGHPYHWAGLVAMG